MTTLKLEAVKQEFDTWRISRSKIGKIPDHLWNKALALLKYYSVSEITGALRLSGGQMKARRKQLEITTRTKFPSKFVEISTATTFGNSSTTLKLGLTRADGATIMLEQVPETTLMHIINNFFMFKGGVACCN
jgi:hypothetical protein